MKFSKQPASRRSWYPSNSWTVTFRANIYEPLDEGMVTLQLRRRKFLHKETLFGFIRLNLNFIYTKNTKKSLFGPLCGE